MTIDPEVKTLATSLRKNGRSYSEIIKQVPVSKSTLSAWLSKVLLLENEKLTLNDNLRRAQMKGAAAKRKQRIDKVERIKKESILEIGKITNKQLFYMGIMLYWAEGTKANERQVGEGIEFTNSDPAMCRLFILWVKYFLKIRKDRITFCIYIHESLKTKVRASLEFWSKQLGVPKRLFKKTYLSKTKFSSIRRRKDNGKYYGQLRIRITKSADLNRKISGWIEGVCLQI